MSKSHTPDILSEEPTQVPPNLCTLHPASAPLGKVVTFSSGNVSINACTSAGTAREKTRRLCLFLPPLSRFVALDFDDEVTIFPFVVFFRHDSDADFDDAVLVKLITDDIVCVYICVYTKSSFSPLSLSLICISRSLSHRRGRENAEKVWTAKNLARKDKKVF